MPRLASKGADACMRKVTPPSVVVFIYSAYLGWCLTQKNPFLILPFHDWISEFWYSPVGRARTLFISLLWKSPVTPMIQERQKCICNLATNIEFHRLAISTYQGKTFLFFWISGKEKKGVRDFFFPFFWMRVSFLRRKMFWNKVWCWFPSNRKRHDQLCETAIFRGGYILFLFLFFFF